MRDRFKSSSRPRTKGDGGDVGGWMTGLGGHDAGHEDQGRRAEEGGNLNWREEYDAWLQDVEDGRASPVLTWQRVTATGQYEGNGGQHDRGEHKRKRRHDEDRNSARGEHSRDRHTNHERGRDRHTSHEWGIDEHSRPPLEHAREKHPGRSRSQDKSEKFLETECRHFLQDVHAGVQRPVSPQRERPSLFSAPLAAVQQPSEPSGKGEATGLGGLEDEAQQKEKKRKILLEKLLAKKNTAKLIALVHQAKAPSSVPKAPSKAPSEAPPGQAARAPHKEGGFESFFQPGHMDLTCLAPEVGPGDTEQHDRAASAHGVEYAQGGEPWSGPLPSFMSNASFSAPGGPHLGELTDVPDGPPNASHMDSRSYASSGPLPPAEVVSTLPSKYRPVLQCPM